MTSLGRLIGALALLCLAMALAPGAALAAGSSISGTVTDAETLEPVEGVEVCAFPLEGEEGWTCGYTVAGGKYELKEMAEGKYGIEFWARSLGYATQFYANKTERAQADPVIVGSEPVTGIDAALGPSPGIAGTVIRSSDGEPVEGIEVCAWPVNAEVEETYWECEYTRADGTYFVDLLPGNYKVEFWPGESGQNLALQFYNGRDRWNESDVVAVKPSERTAGIDAELDPGATISGTVTSAASGTGLEEIRVCSIDAPSGMLWICGWTNPSGHYNLPFHSQGQYKVVFSVNLEEWFGEEVFEDDGFATQFWNNQTTLAAANTIPLSTGQSVPGIDARLSSSVTAPVIAPVTPEPPVVRHRRRHCRRGYVKKKVKGKVRCVKRHKHHRHHRRAPKQRPLFRVAR